MPHEGILEPKGGPRFGPFPGVGFPPAVHAPLFIDAESPWIEHIPFAYWLIEAFAPKTLVALGTACGATYLASCQAIRDLGLTTRAAAVCQAPVDDAEQSAVVIHDARFAAFSRLIRAAADEAATEFAAGSIDLLHIDGSHSRSTIQPLFNQWRKLLSPSAIVLIHGIACRDDGFGATRLFDQLRLEYASFEFRRGHGLGVIAMGTEFPRAIAGLFASAGDALAEQTIRATFALLGANTAADLRLRQALDREKHLGQESAALRDTLDQLRNNSARHAQSLESEISSLYRNLAKLRSELIERDTLVAASRRQLTAILESTSWKLTWPLRRLAAKDGLLFYLASRARKLARWAVTGQLLLHTKYWLKARLARRGGSLAAGLPRGPSRDPEVLARGAVKWTVPQPVDAYECWMIGNPWSERNERLLTRRISEATTKLPSFSVLMPVYRPDLRYFRLAIESVRRQVYGDWELCIADDASESDELTATLFDLAAADKRIKVTRRATNGHISRATNSAAEHASGDFFVLLDQDDELSPDALGELALRIAARPETDLIYSDSDKIDEAGLRYDPHFKPDFSPELLLAYMYAGQTLGIRATLWRDLGGLRAGYEGSQDHDLALRASERARHVEHLPKVLYHWRSLKSSTASSAGAKPYSYEAGRQAVQDALQRRGSGGIARQPDWAAANQNAIFHIRLPDDGPSVGILIPTRNQLPLLRRCIESLTRTTYRNFSVLVVDNESDDRETLDWLEQLPRRTDLTADFLRVDNSRHGKFNFSYLINTGVTALRTDYVVLLNNDVEVIKRDWLSSLVGYARLPGVGCVGALLRYPDGTVQHAGITQTDVPPTLVDHMFKHAGRDDAGYLSFVQLPRDTIGVTAACLLVSRAIFNEIGGFDEANFGVAYNDVDFCYRIAAAGYRNVYTPTAELTHHEGASRGFRDDPRELANFRARYWGRGDRYLNPSLSRLSLSPKIHPIHVTMDGPSTVRVVVVTHNLNLEGAPKAILEATRTLVREGRIVATVISPMEGPLRAEYEAAGVAVEVVVIPSPNNQDISTHERGLVALGKLFHRHQADVVLANTLETFTAIDAAHSVGIPSVWVIHESEGWQDYFRYLPPEVERRALACFGHPYRVVFVSHATRRIYAELDYHHNATVIPGGLDRTALEPFLGDGPRDRFRLELGLKEGDLALLLVGTVCERKGQIDIAGALARIDPATLAEMPQVFIVGDRDSTYSRELHAAISSLPPAWRAKIHVVVETPDVWPYYAAADLFVCPSRMESYPRVILEAMAFGLPIITTPVHGIVEQVRAGINGEFFVPGDVAALARLIREFLDDPVRRARYGANAVEVLRGLNTQVESARILGQALLEAAGSGIAPSRLEQIRPA